LQLKKDSQYFEQFTFTYAIRWEKDTVTSWPARMSHIMKTGNENIHAASILLSLGIISGLTFIVCAMLKRGLNKDYASIALNKIKT